MSNDNSNYDLTGLPGRDLLHELLKYAAILIVSGLILWLAYKLGGNSGTVFVISQIVSYTVGCFVVVYAIVGFSYSVLPAIDRYLQSR